MKVKVDIKCPACRAMTPTQFVKPGFIQPTTFSYRCQNCQSVITVSARRPRHSEGLKPDQLRCNAVLSIPGPELALKMVAEADSKQRQEESRGEER